MAVYNDYVDTQVLAGKANRASALAGGARQVVYAGNFDTVAAHDAGSIYRIIRKIPATAIPLQIWLATDGVTGMNDVDVCLYDPMGLDGTAGAEVGTEVLASAIDLSSAVAFTAPKNGMGNVTLGDYGEKALWELAGQTIRDRNTHFDIGLKSVADLSEADQIAFYAVFAFA